MELIVVYSLIKFPLWYSDGKEAVRMSKIQLEALDIFRKKIISGEYKFIINDCVCGGTSDKSDELIVEKDRFGIECNNVLCNICGVVRLEYRFDEASNSKFYESDYRNLYVGKEMASEKFFNSQMDRGKALLDVLSKNVNIDSINTVFEVGCGAGGIIYPFLQIGKSVSGCDFGEKYIQYGISKGMSLYKGDIDFEKTQRNSKDLVVLSHVMEHFTLPVESLRRIISVILPGKYLLVEVPGVRNIRKAYCDNPLSYFQNAHIFNFHESFLRLFFKAIGMEVVYGDEHCVFLLRKPENWVPIPYQIDLNVLSGESKKTSNDLKMTFFLWLIKMNPYVYRRMIGSILKKMGLHSGIKKFLEKRSG
jgi:SAM-dependent methyltransferase